QRVTLLHPVALICHPHLREAPACREVEGLADDPVHAFPCIQLLLDGDFVFCSSLEAPADADVKALGVLAEHDKVHVLRHAILKRTQPLVEQLHRPIFDVEIELEPRPEQDLARVPIVGDAGIAERADEDRIEVVAQHRVAAWRHRDAGLEKIVRSPGQVLELERAAEHLADAREHFQGFGCDLFAYPVTGDDRELHVSIYQWRWGPTPNACARLRSRSCRETTSRLDSRLCRASPARALTLSLSPAPFPSHRSPTGSPNQAARGGASCRTAPLRRCACT